MRNIKNTPRENAPAIAGVILLIIGGIWLLNVLGVPFPKWLFRPYSVLAAIGIYLGAKKNFSAPFGWVIPLAISACLFTSEFFNFDLWKIGFPLALIGAGIYIVFQAYQKPKLPPSFTPENNNNLGEDDNIVPVEYTEDHNAKRQQNTANAAANEQQNFSNSNYDYNQDVLNTTSIFSGVIKIVNSKNFKGGDIVTILGGADINLAQADMQSPAVIDLTVVMGGVKLIVPSDWEIKNNVTCLLGGVEERRPAIYPTTGEKKLLVLKGTVIMGGIDIRNF
jgi:predicted membrane protein